MAVLEICTFPDKVLLQEAEPIGTIDKHIAQLAEDMAETMYEAPGIGLAANQVGICRRLIVVDIAPRGLESDLIALVNPEIITAEGEISVEEGCLSVPECTCEVKRHERVTVRGLNLQGEPVEIEAEGLLAVVFQHEIDHLNGTLFIDRIGRLKRDFFKRRLRKRAKQEA